MVTCRGDAGCLSIVALGVGTMWSGREVPRSPALWAGLVHDSVAWNQRAGLCYGTVSVLSSDLTRGILRAGLRSPTLEHVDEGVTERDP